MPRIVSSSSRWISIAWLGIATRGLSDSDIEFFAHLHTEAHDAADGYQRQASDQGGEGETNLSRLEPAQPGIVDQPGKDCDLCCRLDDARDQAAEG